MTLRLKERELAAVGASIAAGCKPCTDYHVKAARAAKLDDHEIRQAINEAVGVRQDALEVMKAYGLQHLGEGVDAPGYHGGESTRVEEHGELAHPAPGGNRPAWSDGTQSFGISCASMRT